MSNYPVTFDVELDHRTDCVVVVGKCGSLCQSVGIPYGEATAARKQWAMDGLRQQLQSRRQLEEHHAEHLAVHAAYSQQIGVQYANTLAQQLGSVQPIHASGTNMLRDPDAPKPRPTILGDTLLLLCGD